MPTTTIQVEQETAERLRQSFPGMTYDVAINKLISAPRKSSSIPFTKTISTLEETSEEHRVPFNGTITEVTMYFPAGCEAAVDVRLLYFEGKEKQFVVPAIDEKYIALDDTSTSFIVNFPVKANGKLKVEFLNYDDTNQHIISVIVTLISAPMMGGK